MMAIIFWDFLFHQKGNRAWLLVIKGHIRVASRSAERLKLFLNQENQEIFQKSQNFMKL